MFLPRTNNVSDLNSELEFREESPLSLHTVRQADQTGNSDERMSVEKPLLPQFSLEELPPPQRLSQTSADRPPVPPQRPQVSGYMPLTPHLSQFTVDKPPPPLLPKHCGDKPQRPPSSFETSLPLQRSQLSGDNLLPSPLSQFSRDKTLPLPKNKGALISSWSLGALEEDYSKLKERNMHSKNNNSHLKSGKSKSQVLISSSDESAGGPRRQNSLMGNITSGRRNLLELTGEETDETILREDAN